MGELSAEGGKRSAECGGRNIQRSTFTEFEDTFGGAPKGTGEAPVLPGENIQYSTSNLHHRAFQPFNPNFEDNLNLPVAHPALRTDGIAWRFCDGSRGLSSHGQGNEIGHRRGATVDGSMI